jgi:hypothetical protein
MTCLSGVSFLRGGQRLLFFGYNPDRAVIDATTAPDSNRFRSIYLYYFEVATGS